MEQNPPNSSRGAAEYVSPGRKSWLGQQNDQSPVGTAPSGRQWLLSTIDLLKPRARSLKDFGIDPQAWVKDPTEEGSESVNGVDTTHVHANVDIGRMFSDFNKTIQKAGAMGAVAPQQLSPDTIKKIQDVVNVACHACNVGAQLYFNIDDVPYIRERGISLEVVRLHLELTIREQNSRGYSNRAR